MSGGPTTQNPTGKCRATAAGNSLPERQPSTSEDIAAFVAKAKAMSPYASGSKGPAGFCARRYDEPATDLGHGVRACRPTCFGKRLRSAASTSA